MKHNIKTLNVFIKSRFLDVLPISYSFYKQRKEINGYHFQTTYLQNHDSCTGERLAFSRLKTTTT